MSVPVLLPGETPDTPDHMRAAAVQRAILSQPIVKLDSTGAGPLIVPPTPQAIASQRAIALPDQEQPTDTAVQIVRPSQVQAPRQYPAVKLPEQSAQTASVIIAKPQPANRFAPVQLPTNPTLQHDQAELQRLKTTGSGISQIRRTPLKVLARIGDVAMSSMFPTVAAQVPGTELHHQRLINQQEGLISEDLAEQQQQQHIASEQQKQDIERQNNELVQVSDIGGNTFTIPRSQLTTWQTKTNATTQRGEAAQKRFVESLATKGLKLDDDGQIVPMTEEELPVVLRGELELKKVREDYYGALTELAKSKNDPNSPSYKLALQRLAVARQNAAAAAQRAAAYTLNATSGAYGTDPQGNPLPGAMITDEGQAVGAKFQQNVRPTGQQRGKANLAQSADEQLKDLEEIVTRRKDIFGPAAGRITDFRTWVGSQDPDAQRFRAARTIAGDHLAGVFGGRSEAALTAIDAAIGHYKDNQKAIIAGLDQLSKANSAFVKAGTYITVGSSGNHNAAPRRREGSRDTRPPLASFDRKRAQ